MEIVLIQNIKCGDDKIPKPIYKVVNSNIIPHKGDFINDTVWKEPYEYEVVQVVIDYTYDRCEVLLSKYEEEWDRFEDFAKMAELHGWSTHYPMKTK